MFPQGAEKPLIDSLERLRLTTHTSQADWLDLLQLHWDDYQKLKAGEIGIDASVIERVTEHFQLSSQDFIENKVDFKWLAQSDLHGHSITPTPLRYTQAAYGRKRASINAVDFLERIGGWRLRYDLLESLSFPEAELQDPFGSISVQFMTDVCAYLNRRQFDKETLFAMGADTYQATRHSLVGKIFSEMRSVPELYEHFFGDCMRLFEANCDYRLTRITAHEGTLEVRSNTGVAEQLGVKQIGNAQLCTFKAGMIACIPQFLGRAQAEVKETKCVHHGDHCCRFEFKFESTPLS